MITTLYCQRSGIAIAQIRILAVGGTPYIRDASKLMYHPIYAKSLDEILRITKRDLRDLELAAFVPGPKLAQSLQLDVSAILYKLGALMDDYACLPSEKVAIGSAGRIVSLASWYHHTTSKRIKFPRYHPCKDNDNDAWNNLSKYLDACFAVKDDWANKIRVAEEDEETKELRELARMEVKRSATYKRVDHEKVWNWMASQMKDKYSFGRLVTWHDLWKNGDIEQEKWVLDDIEDLQFAVIECCDVGNEIMHFISQRLKHIREMIRDFYSSFTLLSISSSNINAHPDLTPEEKEKESAFFSEYDRRIESLSELPAAPQRKDYMTNALFMKAEAQHRLLVKRFNLQKGQQK